MKLKATKKDIKNSFNTILSLGYCQAQSLLYFAKPFAYSAGIYGWSCDYFEVKNICISTGYSPIGQSIDYDLVKEYEEKASKIIYNNYELSYEDKKEQVNSLLNEFITKAKEGL